MELKYQISEAFAERARKIEVILMDCDGVLTSGHIVYDSNGVEIKHFNAHDGLGIKMARLAGLKTGIISMRDSGTIRTRAKELGYDFLYLGRMDKCTAFADLSRKLGLEPEKFCFVGDDLPDVPVMQQVGLPVAVQNAVDIVKQHAFYVTRKKGGEGAIREIVELILYARGSLKESIEKIWQVNK